ncbi:hypothetical protein HA075_17600 [bacterium BFN5]|nr:hypothetical protein HA075_17600 [bacterium BFN5]
MAKEIKGGLTIISRFLTKQVQSRVTLRLIIIIVFLVSIGIGNAVGIYDAFTKNDVHAMALSGAACSLYFIPAYGLLYLKTWARNLELVLSILLVLFGILVLFFESIIVGMAMIIPHGLIGLYLLSRECKEIFSGSDV